MMRLKMTVSVYLVSDLVIYSDTTGQLSKRKEWQGEEWLKRGVGWGGVIGGCMGFTYC